MSALTKYRFTVEQYERMAVVGLLPRGRNFELIEGEIVEMPPIGARHAGVTDRLDFKLGQRLGARAIVRVQGPVRVGAYSEPQPDVVVLAFTVDEILG